MSQENIEQLLLKAAELPNNANLNAVYKAFEADPDSVKNSKDALNLLFESFDPEAMNITIANFILAICSFPVENSSKLRLLLTAAIKMMLPPYLDRPAVLKALGLRDANIPPSNIIGRFRKLSALKNGQIVFLNSSSRWGSVGNIDTIAGSVVVNQFGSAGSSGNVPLDLVLVTGALLSSGLEILKIADSSGRTKMSSGEFRAIVAKKAVVALNDSHMMQMARAGVGAKMTAEEFEAWWNNASAVSAVAKRRSCDGRSLQEIILLLDGEDASVKFEDDEVEKFCTFFTNLKNDAIRRDPKRLAEVLVKVSSRGTPEQLSKMLSPLQAKCPFWPADPIRAPHEGLAVWSDLAAKDIAVLAVLTKDVFGSSYIAALAMRLPQKALTGVAALADMDELDELITEQHSCSSDLSVWIWKNRKKGAEKLTHHLHIDNLIRALSQEGLPKAWTNGLRELRNLLMDNAEFHKFLINLAGDPMKITASLQAALFLTSGERQSLVVKLARSSKELQSHLEKGAGAKILTAGMSEDEIKRNNDRMQADNEPSYTSMASHRMLIKELDDIVKIHQPENREALKAARAHGDFRENSEYDAAKERRNFLSRRRGELEKELMSVLAIDMRKVAVSDTAVIGSKVTVKYEESGKTEVFYLLGAWDGNPEKNYLSYKTRLGQLLYNQKKGAALDMPNGKKAVLAEVAPLDEAVLADMD